MKAALKHISFWKKPVIFYPFLFAAYPLLFLYAHNVSEMSISQIIMPAVVSVLAAFLLWMLLSLILKDVSKAALATSLVLFFFFFYGHFYELLENKDIFVPKHSLLLPGALLVLGYCIYFIKIAHRNFQTTSRILNVVAAVLIVINLGVVASYEITKAGGQSQVVEPEPEAIPTIDQTKLSTMPDIYYLIFDEYANPSTIKEFYNYDNSQFVADLTDKGFFVAGASKTKTMYTYRSIASTLDMEYLGDPDALPDQLVYQKMASNKVVDFLVARGYKYVYFGTWYEFKYLGAWYEVKKYEVNADLYYNFYAPAQHSVVITDFSRIFWNSTMARPFYDYLTQGQYETYNRSGLIKTLEQLKKMPEVPGPKFVFAHIMSPHCPFVFGPNGERVGLAGFYTWDDRQFYLGQYIFITKQIEELVDVLLQTSASPPVIIIQSDHGVRPIHPGIVIGPDEWQKIFNAYYLPGGGEKLLYDSISPVNSFRIVFNYYFGTDYDLLKD
jgi:hypothetical protein